MKSLAMNIFGAFKGTLPVFMAGIVMLAGIVAAPSIIRAETIGGLAFADTARHAKAMTPADAYNIVGAEDLMALSPMNEDGTIRAIVEIPTGTSAKWEVSKDNPKAVYWEYRKGAPRIVNYLGYPGNLSPPAYTGPLPAGF